MLKTFWNVSYWTLFALCWVFLPLLIDYVDAGEFSIPRRILRAFINNLIFYGVVGVIAVIAFLILYFTQKDTFQK